MPTYLICKIIIIIQTIKRASEMNDDDDLADDVIGFGSVKDVNNGEYG